MLCFMKVIKLFLCHRTLILCLFILMIMFVSCNGLFSIFFFSRFLVMEKARLLNR